ncbi:MAG: glycosyltransferase family 2 protein [Clostridiales bacterium]|nr:glycosyltransferase family 2 protein [Clostridiales bacterium]
MKISVIMPVYNSGKFLEKSVRSVMMQTLDDIELIAVNDASTDNSLELLTEMKEEYGKKLVVIDLPENIRQGGARNKGLEVAQGEYIAFIDSDDWIEKNMLEDFYLLAKKKHSDLIGTGLYNMFFSENDIRLIDCGSERIFSEFSDKIFTEDLRNKALFCLGGIWRNIFKKSIIEKYHIRFPENLSYEDNYFMTMYLAYIKSYSCCNKAYYYYVQHENSTIHKKDNSQMQRIIVEKMLLNDMKERGLFEKLKDGYELMAIQRWYINTLGIIYKYRTKESNKIASQVKKEFHQYFPYYKKNIYYKTEISFSDRLKLNLLEINPLLLGILYLIKNRKRLKNE